MRRIDRPGVPVFLGTVMVLAGCSPGGEGSESPLGPDAPAAMALSADRCTNVSLETASTLGLVALPGGGFGFGAQPFAATVGGISGWMFSWVVMQEFKGSGGQAAQKLILHHRFDADDGVSWFQTDDRAVCAPIGTDPLVCRVNDLLKVVDGEGLFADAAGTLRNHGLIDLNSFTITLNIRGRACGDGVGP